jgi:Peptidase M61 N-terminal domain
MRRLPLVLLAMGPLVTGWAPAADLTLRVDAREVMRNHLHTDMTLAVHGGPLTLVFPQWIPGEHGPTGPLDTLIALTLRANGTTLSWQRDPFDMFAIKLTVPAGAT